MATVTPMAVAPGFVPHAPGDTSQGTPDHFLRDLESLVARLEDSFTGTETGASPGTTARLHVEKERISRLIQKLAACAPGDSVNTSVEDSQLSSRSISGPDGDVDGDGAVAWKRNTLLRLRKFLKKKYRMKKTELIDSASKTSCTSEWLVTEKAQIMQIAADIRSIEFEIRLLSGAKTVVQHGKLGSASAEEHKGQGSLLWGREGAEQGRSREGDEYDADADMLTVKRNLLSVYAEGGDQGAEGLADAAHSTVPIPEGAAEEEEEEEELPSVPVAQPTPDQAGNMSTQSSVFSSGDARYAVKIDHRPNLRTVKRNLLSCYTEPDGGDGSRQTTRGPLKAVRKICENTESDEASVPITSARRPMRVQRSPGPDSGAKQWTDVDLQRWATLSKVALSPVAKGNTASPMPIVLRHRVLTRGELRGEAAAPDEDECVEDLEGGEGALILDIDDEGLAGTLQQRSGVYVELPNLRVDEARMQYEARCVARAAEAAELSSSPASVFDRSAEAEANEGDRVLMRTIAKIFRGANRGTPLTSRYKGSDPELLQQGPPSRSEADFLAAACAKALPLSCVCEGRKLLQDFQEFELYDTVAHPSSDILKFKYAQNASPGDKKGDSSLVDSPCNKKLSFTEVQAQPVEAEQSVPPLLPSCADGGPVHEESEVAHADEDASAVKGSSKASGPEQHNLDASKASSSHGIFGLTGLAEDTSCVETQTSPKKLHKRKSPGKRASPKNPTPPRSKAVVKSTTCTPSPDAKPKARPVNRPTTPTPHRRPPFRGEGGGGGYAAPASEPKALKEQAVPAPITCPPRVSVTSRAQSATRTTSPPSALATTEAPRRISDSASSKRPQATHKKTEASPTPGHRVEPPPAAGNGTDSQLAADVSPPPAASRLPLSDAHSAGRAPRKEGQSDASRSEADKEVCQSACAPKGGSALKARTAAVPLQASPSSAEAHEATKQVPACLARTPQGLPAELRSPIRASLKSVSQTPPLGVGAGLNNKADLMSSIRLARTGTGAAPNRVVVQDRVAAPNRVVVQDRVRSLRPLPPPLPASGSSGEQASLLGGKRVLPPTVVGGGVQYLNPCSTPPCAGTDDEMLEALRKAAAEKLQIYRRSTMGEIEAVESGPI